MNWYHSPRTLQALAAAYALGTLAGPARRRFETVMRQQPAAAQAVAQWNRRFAPLAQHLPPAQASAGLWQRIEQQAFGQAAGAAAAPAPAQAARDAGAAPRQATRPLPRAAAKPAWMRWLDALLAPAPAAALAMGMLFGLAMPLLMSTLRAPAAQETELPESYVGVLATPAGKTGLIVSSLRHGKVLDVKRVGVVEVPPGKLLYLWTLDAQGQAAPVGPLPVGPFVRVPLAQEAEALFSRAVELAVSLEDAAAAPSGPTGAWVYRGLCGKLWRVPAAPAATSAPDSGARR